MFDQLVDSLTSKKIPPARVRKKHVSKKEHLTQSIINTSSDNISWFDHKDENFLGILREYVTRTQNHQCRRFICIVWREDGKVTVFPTTRLAKDRLEIPHALQSRAGMRNPYHRVHGYQFATYLDGMSLECPPVPASGRLRQVMLHAVSEDMTQHRFYTNFLSAATAMEVTEADVRVAVACNATITGPRGSWKIKAATLSAMKKHGCTWVPKDYQMSIAKTDDYNETVRTGEYSFHSRVERAELETPLDTFRRLMAEAE